MFGGLIAVYVYFILFPYSRDIEEFIEVFKEASQYLEVDFLDFLGNGRDNLNPKAYAALRKNVDINTVREELARQRDLFVAWVQDPWTRCESHYVPEEVMRD